MTNSNNIIRLAPTKMVIDSRGVAHTTSTCEEVTLPAVGDCPSDLVARAGFLVCADCD